MPRCLGWPLVRARATVHSPSGPAERRSTTGAARSGVVAEGTIPQGTFAIFCDGVAMSAGRGWRERARAVKRLHAVLGGDTTGHSCTVGEVEIAEGFPCDPPAGSGSVRPLGLGKVPEAVLPTRRSSTTTRSRWSCSALHRGKPGEPEPRLIHAHCRQGAARHFCPPTSHGARLSRVLGKRARPVRGAGPQQCGRLTRPKQAPVDAAPPTGTAASAGDGRGECATSPCGVPARREPSHRP
jgi:hypothetical protein